MILCATLLRIGSPGTVWEARKSEKLTFRTGYGFLLAVGTPGVAWKGFQDFTGSLIRSVKHIRLRGRNCAENRNCTGR
jgi:hypothetical protein